MNNGGRFSRFERCLFCGNASGRGGGAFESVSGQELQLVNCTASHNTAPKGKFLLEETPTAGYGTTEIHNCIIADGSGELSNDKGTITIRYTNLVGGASVVDDPSGLIVWEDGNIDVDPYFADPGHWDTNGTPDDSSDDFFVAGDYHLKSQAGRWDPNSASWVQDDVTSPCIDAGDPNSSIGYEPFPNGGRINMGAYGGTAEASKPYLGEPVCETIIAGDINGDCIVDFEDFRLLALHWMAGVPVPPPPPDGEPEPITLR
jgi:hypothetical protein